MQTLTRRTFANTVLGALPLMHDSLRQVQTETPKYVVHLPERVAGYLMTNEERRLALTFLENHEKNMQPLRERELPNGLAPSFIFASPGIKGEEGAVGK
jgi:hypothetical protein